MDTAVCPFCACEVPTRAHPWLYRRHDIYGQALASQAAPICVGSRSVFTLELLGLTDTLKATP